MTQRSRTAQINSLRKARDAARQKYGDQSVSLGSQRYHYNVVESPSVMLDYKMGIGGIPYGHAIEVFGANGLGKTSVMGYTTVANVQKQNKVPAVIAAEPVFDYEWASKFGVDPELMMLYRPDNAEEAFEMLHDLVYGDLVDYVLIDSLGAMAAASETEEGGKKKAFGISGIVTTGLNRVIPRMFKSNIGVMILNQQRQDTKQRAQPGSVLYDSPGGEALHHNCVIRIHLKPGKARFTKRIGDETVLVGRELICSFKKNKLAMNPTAAKFIYYHVPTPEYGFGVDVGEDYTRVGKLTGVLSGSGWIRHPTFPGGRLNGKEKVAQFLNDNPEAMQTIRDEILAKMSAEQIELRKQADQQKVGNGAKPPEEESTDDAATLATDEGEVTDDAE